MSFNEEMEAKSFTEGSGAWSRWFSSIDPWVGQSFPFERLAWLNIYGVPPHLFSRAIFNLIGGRYGRVVHESQIQEDDGDLTFDCLGVLTDNGNLISGALKLNWQDKIYRVWIKEEPSVWVSDCTGNINDGDDVSSEFDVGDNMSSAEGMNVVQDDVEVVGEQVIPADPVGDPGLAAHEKSRDAPMHVENCNHKFSPPGVAFDAQNFNPPPCCPSRPSFKDHWANLVGRSLSRPRKIQRS
ncbi:hypothetical protein HanPI659440_Chr11g0410431 [Helianthus annuus]|nr:hypothetical protein HanPI659440_Chr11g0410431 [Helianthus annuus]